MKTHAAILVLFVLNVTNGYGQNRQYDYLVAQARKSFEAKNYLQSGNYYSNAFQELGGKGIPQDRYDASKAWTLAENKDSAFFNLFRLADKTDFLELQDLITEVNFNRLHDDNRWQQLLDKINPNHEVYQDSLAAMLSLIHDDDQKYRKKIGEVGYKYGKDSKEFKQLMSQMSSQDSIDLVIVTQTLDHYGWLSKNEVGNKGNTALWVVIQHADLGVQEKYYPVMQAAVENHKASRQHLAYLEDRILMRQEKKQLYGTQYKLNPKNNEMELWEIEDPENLNKRRESVGLPPM